jgi:hypothetical protein
MNPTPPLSGAHERTYEAIFRHPVAHNLAWREVHALLRHVGTLTEEANGNLKATRNGQTLVLHPSRMKDVTEIAELLELRRFLERSADAATATAGRESHWLVVIDHHEARVYHSFLPGAKGEQILPHEPADFFRHAHNSKDFARGREKPEPNSFFAPVTQALGGAGQILVFGSGKGTASEMEQFVAWLKQHHPAVAGRIVGTVVVDEHHLTEPQLLAKAREFHAGVAAAV